jgi:hypothetical protein
MVPKVLGGYVFWLMVFTGTAYFGVVMLLFAWGKALKSSSAGRRQRISPALLAFTASVFVNLAFFAIIPLIVDQVEGREIWKIPLGVFILCCIQTGSILLLVTSLVVVRRDSAPARRIVKIGSIVIIGANILAFTLSLLP